jgi:hypothetical protein
MAPGGGGGSDKGAAAWANLHQIDQLRVSWGGGFLLPALTLKEGINGERKEWAQSIPFMLNRSMANKAKPWYNVKKVKMIFPAPAGMSSTKVSLAGNNKIFPGHGEFSK